MKPEIYKLALKSAAVQVEQTILKLNEGDLLNNLLCADDTANMEAIQALGFLVIELQGRAATLLECAEGCDESV